MTAVTVHRASDYTRYCVMPGFFESWTYADGRRPVYAIHCTPARAADIPTDVLTALWGAMHKETGFVPTETERKTPMGGM